MKMTLRQLMDRFPDEEACRAHLQALRWPQGVACPRCGATTRIYKGKGRWTCKNADCGGRAGYRFSLTTGTIFQDTKYPLRTWFQVLFLMLSSKKGMSAHQIHRIIGSGSYETAWYMCHRLRAAMRDPEFFRLTGIVEVDETYIGGKNKNRHGGGAGMMKRTGKRSVPNTKYPVIGAIARKGNVVAQAIDIVSGTTMRGFVHEVVSDKVSLVATDQHTGYRKLGEEGYPHETVNHHEQEYVRGEVHTANLDSFWSLLKRGIIGNFHHVSWGYLPMYLNEFSFRHNHRHDADAFDRVLESC